jgi:hypothetical protein
MGKIVSRFPVVKSLIAVLNRRKPGGNEGGGEEPVKGRDGLHRVGAGSPRKKPVSSWNLKQKHSTSYFFFAWLASGCTNCRLCGAVFGAIVVE